MTLDDLFVGGGVGVVAVLSLLEIAPIKVNPWSAIARGLGRAFNAEVLADLKAVQQAQQDTRSALDKHQAADDEYKAECHRAFRHIDQYEDYCRSHPGYKNNRASHAIANIGRVYDERLKARDFLGGVTHEE